MSNILTNPFVVTKGDNRIDVSLRAFPEAPVGWESQSDMGYRQDHLILVTVYGFPVLDLDFSLTGFYVQVLGAWYIDRWPWKRGK